MESYLEFEKPILQLDKQLIELRALNESQGHSLQSEVDALEAKKCSIIQEITQKLSPWQRVQLSRHPLRPYSQDYIQSIFPDFRELHGDRRGADDRALIAGAATFSPQKGPPIPVLLLGQKKGRSTKQKLDHNFGMMRPEGYHKARRIFELADRFTLPIISFVDTPGAYPSIDAEKNGQSFAIAETILASFSIRAPYISIIIGEGGSGGALALATADRVLMLEHAIYSVISPEGCASILYNDASRAPLASEKLKITARDLMNQKVIDQIIEEPLGGAHRDPAAMFKTLKKILGKNLKELLECDPKKLPESRRAKFRAIGPVNEEPSS